MADDQLPAGFKPRSMPQNAAPKTAIPEGFRPRGEAAPDYQIQEAPKPTGVGQNAALPALQGLTFGWGDEALAGVLAAYATFMPELAGGLPDDQDLNQNYENIRDQIRGDTKAYAEENPATAAIAEAGGAMLTGGTGLVKAGAKPAAGIIERLMRNAGIGAAEGAVYGAGQGEEGTRGEGAAEGAKTGAMFGAAGGEVIRKAQKWLGNKSEMQEYLLEKISQGSDDIDTAFYKVIRDVVDNPPPPINTNVPRLNAPEGMADDIFESVRPVGTPRLVKDRAQVNAARQGVSENVLPVIARANRATKDKLSRMNKVLGENLKNAKVALTQRASDVAGESAMDRFSAIRGINREAGRKIDAAAKDLKNFNVDFNPAVNDFLLSLDDLGVNLGRSPQELLSMLNNPVAKQRKELLFEGADFKGMKQVENVLDEVLQRMLGKKVTIGKGMNAHDGHRLKKYLDTQVSFGADGAKIKDSPAVHNALKFLRHDVDGILDNNFDNYRIANEDYAKTVEVMNEFQRLMPNHVDLIDPSKSADAAVGTQLRAVLSNRRSRIPTIDVLAQLDNVAKDYGVKFEDDLLTQIMYMDELEQITGSSARAGLSGEIGKSLRGLKEGVNELRRPVKDAVTDWLVNKGDDALFGEKSNENLIKALDELLKAE